MSTKVIQNSKYINEEVFLALLSTDKISST